jgi:DNA recombination protein RmuC
MILAIASAFLAGALLVWLWQRGREAGVAERLRAKEDEAARLGAELSALRAAREISTAQQARTEQELSDLKQMRTALQTEFQAVATRLLDEKSAKFTEQNRVQIDAIMNPLRQQLGEFRTRIDTVYKTESDDRTALKAQIEQLRILNRTITEETHSLTHALKGQSQFRGAWGELVLERLLEGSGLRRGENYVVQETLAGADGRGRVRPDVILRLPEQRHLVIDSKVSLVDYEQAVNAADPASRETALKAHVEALRGHVKDLAGKQYTDAGELVTPDYVLMFVPIEPALTIALNSDSGLYEWAFDRRVIIVTAPNLLVTLKTVATLWRQDRQARNVQEIARRGGLLYDKFVGLYEDLESVGDNLDKARQSYDDVLSKLKTGRGNLLSQVEDIRTLGAKAQKSLPPADPPSV